METTSEPDIDYWDFISSWVNPELEAWRALHYTLDSALLRNVLRRQRTIKATSARQRQPVRRFALSKREKQVLECADLENWRIAELLHISKNTVRNHWARIYRYAGVHKRSQLMEWRERNKAAAEGDQNGKS